MAHFGTRSLERLDTLHPDIQRVLKIAIQTGPDFTITGGFRGRRAQEAAFRKGNTKAHFGRSKHNAMPSLAVDLAPYPVDWNDTNRFRFLAGYVLGVADAIGVPLRWGGDWDRDFDEKDERFRDMPHFELTGPKADYTMKRLRETVIV